MVSVIISHLELAVLVARRRGVFCWRVCACVVVAAAGLRGCVCGLVVCWRGRVCGCVAGPVSVVKAAQLCFWIANGGRVQFENFLSPCVDLWFFRHERFGVGGSKQLKNLPP